MGSVQHTLQFTNPTTAGKANVGDTWISQVEFMGRAGQSRAEQSSAGEQRPRFRFGQSHSCRHMQRQGLQDAHKVCTRALITIPGTAVTSAQLAGGLGLGCPFWAASSGRWAAGGAPWRRRVAAEHESHFRASPQRPQIEQEHAATIHLMHGYCHPGTTSPESASFS